MSQPRPRGTLMGEGVPDALARDGRAPRVLAFHGFGGTPQEVALVVEVAAGLGLGAEAPLLPGHGARVSDLAPLRFQDWLDAAEESYCRLAARGPVVVVGLSMGSLLALTLAIRYPETTLGVVVLANAVWLRNPWPGWALRLVDRCHLPDFWMPKTAPGIADPEQKVLHLTYNAQPVRSAISVLRAGEKLVPELHRVRAPALVVHGEQDEVCPVANAWRVAVRLGSVQKRTVLLPQSRHIVTRDLDRELLRRELEVFLSGLCAGLPASN